MIKRTTVHMGRKQVLGAVVCGVIALSLVGVAVYMAVSAVGRLGLIGQQLTMRVTYCDATAPATTSRGGGHPDLVCRGFVDPSQASEDGKQRITATGFSSQPRFGAPVEVSKEPWGSWVPVDQGDWNRLGRALSPLIPLAVAGFFAKVPVAVWRGRRNSGQLVAGASA
ncbi:hypothetical protein JHN63_21910 [Streptomyces sp. MBT65]|uniref:hypothetical protein n=1 Tax=Streptomyces sp. MBT65 TaxID=1488395 RepID=UPI00190BD2CC|nr:hypothetical protein [Streptomyces sp. MBT65]MBK3576420.1 hypothetical protein [Streptomyces sp. MBT65]